MGETLTTVVAIFLAVVLMFVFPLVAVSERGDDISQLSVETAVADFVDNSRSIGKITMDNYDKLVNVLNATGNTYDIEIEVKHLDENIGKKTAWTEGSVIGENVYYSVYTTQILDKLTKDGGDKCYNMKEGDIISCSVKNTNVTLSQSLRSMFYSSSMSNSYQVSAQHSGIVTATAK